MAWNPYGALGIAVMLLSIWIAWLIWRARPRDFQNIAGALMLLFNGLYQGIFNGVRLLMDDIAAAYAFAVLGWLIVLIGIGPLLWFPATLAPRSRKWVTRPAVLWLTGLAPILLGLHLVFRPAAWIVRMEPFAHLEGFANVSGPMRSLSLIVLLAVFLYGFVAALQARKYATNTVARRKANRLALAFGLYDLLVFGWILVYVFATPHVSRLAAEHMSFAWQLGAAFLRLVLLGYAMLSSQLLEVDLKIKFGIRASTIASIFTLTIIVGKQFLEETLDIGGSIWTSVAIAVVLSFALRPIDRFAKRVAEKLMPGVEDTEEYRQKRREELYAAALAEAEQQGLTKQEQAGLLALRKKLGLA